MKKKYFYSHLISIEILGDELDSLNLNPSEKIVLLELADRNIHHEVMDAILSQLDGEDKKKFMELLVEDKHEEIWKHLNDKTNDLSAGRQDIEKKIKQAADQIRKELTEDIRKLKSQ